MQVASNAQLSSGDIRRIEYILFGSEMEKLSKTKQVRARDWRELPVYLPAEVAHYLGIKHTTLKNWIYGRYYHTRTGRKWFDPIIMPADKPHGLLSFYNLAEAHVLASTRYQHHVPLIAVRDAIHHIKQIDTSKHPLLSKDFYTDGKDLFVKTITQVENLSMQGQLGLKEVLEQYLERIIRDDKFRPVKVYPIIKGQPKDNVIAIIHGVSSGRPVIDGTGVPVSIIWQRHKAGEHPDVIADDFEIPVAKIKRAIEYIEHNPKAAA